MQRSLIDWNHFWWWKRCFRNFSRSLIKIIALFFLRPARGLVVIASVSLLMRLEFHSRPGPTMYWDLVNRSCCLLSRCTVCGSGRVTKGIVGANRKLLDLQKVFKRFMNKACCALVFNNVTAIPKNQKKTCLKRNLDLSGSRMLFLALKFGASLTLGV